MKDNGNRFQLMILESPYENWADPRTQDFFAKMVMLKKKGYEHFYSNGVLPVDTSDFLATHLLLCERHKNGEMTPVMGYKTVSLEKCRAFNQNFPGLSLVQNAKMPVHSEVVQSIINRCEQKQRGLAYLGSWTVDPLFKQRQNETANLKEAFVGFYRLLYQEQKVHEVIIGGTLRFKTEKLFGDLGHKPLMKNGEILSSIHVAHLVKEPVLVMHSMEFNDFSMRAEAQWSDVWENRIYIKDSAPVKLRIVA